MIWDLDCLTRQQENHHSIKQMFENRFCSSDYMERPCELWRYTIWFVCFTSSLREVYTKPPLLRSERSEREAT